jgi:hypothetical protein
MDNRGRGCLRIVELPNSAAGGKHSFDNTQQIALLLGDGKGCGASGMLPGPLVLVALMRSTT